METDYGRRRKTAYFKNDANNFDRIWMKCEKVYNPKQNAILQGTKFTYRE